MIVGRQRCCSFAIEGQTKSLHGIREDCCKPRYPSSKSAKKSNRSKVPTVASELTPVEKEKTTHSDSRKQGSRN